MDFTDQYAFVLWGVFVVIATWIVQWFVASMSKASQPGAIPGQIDASLSHDSFVFRAHRTFMNSLENLPALLGTAFLAVLAGADPFWSGLLVWVFAIARIIHMVLYYAIATERNPSPRSYFFLIGMLAQIGLLGVCAAGLI